MRYVIVCKNDEVRERIIPKATACCHQKRRMADKSLTLKKAQSGKTMKTETENKAENKKKTQPQTKSSNHLSFDEHASVVLWRVGVYGDRLSECSCSLCLRIE